jgi:capsid assembly protease
MKAYSLILNAVYSQVWAIQPEKLEAMVGFLELKAMGHLPDADVLASIQAASAVTAAKVQQASATGAGSVAVLPLYGLIMQRGNMVGDISGPRGTSVEQFKEQFRQAVDDPGIKAIVIDVDSPGGTVSGVDELASEIYAARGQKKIIAVSNCLMASAAYYIACSATEIVASPSSQTGSIGIFAALRDESAALEKAGIKVHLITYGENKAAGDPRVPITEGAIADLTKMVHAYGGMFDAAVGRGRKISATKVHETYGQGLTFTAKDAVKLGMVDRVGTIDDVLAELGVRGGSSRIQMQAQNPQVAAGTPQAGEECECPCGPCEAGNCEACSHENCDCAGCTCAMAEGKASALRSHAARKRRLEIAAA